MADLTAHPVTPHELDMWLRSTDMDDDDVKLQPQRPLPNLGAPLSAATADRTKKKKNKPLNRYRRRSSLDCVDVSAAHGNCFGIDARTALLASANASGRFRRRNNEEQDHDVAAAVDDRQDNGNNRVNRIVSEGDASSIGTREMEPIATSPHPFSRWERSSSGCSHHSSHSQYSNHSHYSNRSNRTPLQGNHVFHRSVSDVSVQPLCQEEPGLSPGSFTRSLSLPTGNNSPHFDSPSLQVCHSLPIPGHSTISQPAVAASTGPGPGHTLQDLSHFLNAMELSQKSQDAIHSGGHVRSRRSIVMMRETNRSRELLLSVLSASHANRSPISRRSSASQVIGNHGSHNSRRGSVNAAMSGIIEESKSFSNYPNHFRNNNNKHMSVGSWRQQDMRNIMLCNMMEEEENAILSGEQNNSAARYLSGCWKPAPKHYHSNNYSSSSIKQHHFHHPSKQQHLHQGEFNQESAVQAELRRIAREQILEMEQQQQYT